MTGGDMEESDFLKPWSILSSTSRFFPAHAQFEIRRNGAGFELEVTWENGTNLKVIEEGFGLEEGTLKGRFLHPKKKPEPPLKQKEFELVVTLCRANSDRKHRLLGLLLPFPGDRGDEGTGVFVAEAVPIGEPPGEST